MTLRLIEPPPEVENQKFAPVENQAYLEFAENFGDEWVFDPDVEPLETTWQAASVGRDSLSFERNYGPQIRQSFDTQAQDLEKFRDLSGWWVRMQQPLAEVDLGGISVPTERTVFLGRIEEPRDVLHGDQLLDSGSESFAKGQQRWASGGGRRVLEKLAINDSSWLVSGQVVFLDREAGFNLRNGSDVLGGNRSATREEVPGTLDRPRVYHLGGTDDWTALQIADYALEVYVSRRLPTAGPPFAGVIASQKLIDELRAWTPKIDLESVPNVARLFDELFSSKRGMDWHVKACEDGAGYEIVVFPLLPEVPEFVDLGYPVNRSLQRFSASADQTNQVDVNVSRAARHERLRVRGEFITVTGTVAADGTTTDQLVAGWEASAEQDYKDGDPSGNDPAAHAEYRARDDFRDVFQKFIVSGWTMFGGQNPVFVDETDPDADLVADAARIQVTEVGTLKDTMLEVGADYTVFPPVVNRGPAQSPEYLPLMAWVYFDGSVAFGGKVITRFVPVDQISEAWDGAVPSGTIQALANEIGLRFEVTPNHVFALNHWNNASVSETSPSVDWRTIVATLTVETDHRVAIEVALPEDSATEDGSVFVTDVPGIRLDCLAPQTVVGVDSLGNLVQSPDSLNPINDDRPRLLKFAAGVVARYLYERARAQVNVQGRVGNLDPLVGSILEITGDQNATKILTPVTSVRVNWRDKRATIFCGQAGR